MYDVFVLPGLTVDTYQRWQMGGHRPSAFDSASLMGLFIDHNRKNPKRGWMQFYCFGWGSSELGCCTSITRTSACRDAHRGLFLVWLLNVEHSTENSRPDFVSRASRQMFEYALHGIMGLEDNGLDH